MAHFQNGCSAPNKQGTAAKRKKIRNHWGQPTKNITNHDKYPKSQGVATQTSKGKTEKNQENKKSPGAANQKHHK